MLRGACVSLLVLVATQAIGCSPTRTKRRDRCLHEGTPALLFPAYITIPSPLGGADPGLASLQVYYGGDPTLHELNLDVGFWVDGNFFDARVPLIPTEQILRSSVGSSFFIKSRSTVELTRDKERICSAEQELATTVEINAGAGTIDLDEHTIDRAYRRTIDITVDWPTPGCGVPPVKTVLTFEISADTVQIGCDDLFRIVDSDAGVSTSDGG